MKKAPRKRLQLAIWGHEKELREIAEDLPYSDNGGFNLSNIASGRRGVSKKRMEIISKYFGTSPGWMFGKEYRDKI